MNSLIKQTTVRVWPQAVKQVACYASSTVAAVNEPFVELKEPTPKKRSERFLAFQKKLREKLPLATFNELSRAPFQADEAYKPWPNNTNPYTGEIGGPAGPEPTRYGDWQYKGRVTDF